MKERAYQPEAATQPQLYPQLFDFHFLSKLATKSREQTFLSWQDFREQLDIKDSDWTAQSDYLALNAFFKTHFPLALFWKSTNKSIQSEAWLVLPQGNIGYVFEITWPRNADAQEAYLKVHQVGRYIHLVESQFFKKVFKLWPKKTKRKKPALRQATIFDANQKQ